MSDTVLTYLDSYCERAGQAGVFAEPLNAVTNVFFIVGAVMAARAIVNLTHHSWRSVWDIWALIITLVFIGIGSGLWHLTPNGTTVLMDVLPITLFIHLYLVFALRQLCGLSRRATFFWWVVYLAASVIAQATLPADLFHGTIMYIPTYLTLILLAAAIARRDRAVGRVVWQMVGLWTASLVLRTVDLSLCATLPIGTHFLWHTLNAILLYQLIMVLIASRRVAA